jgi:outer membrane receptor protein involved in Fe transport
MRTRRISSSRWWGECFSFSVVAVCVLATIGAGAMAQEEAPQHEMRLEPVVVTATRTGLSEGEPAASATMLSDEDIEMSANSSVDDILHTIPGFSLYRRSSSLVTPPDLDIEAQGVTLRNIGPAGASHALVMVDGVPIMGAFDGQVFWGKVPQESIDHIEVVRGSGASLWGNYAMAGVINIITRKPTETGASLRASYGTDGLTDDYLSVTGRQGKLMVGVDGDFFNLDGFPVVASNQRGPIDGNGSSRHEVFNGRVGYQFSEAAAVWLHGQLFDQAYNYGTALRTSHTDAGLIDLTGTLHTDDGSEWQAMLFSNQQRFHIQFSEALDPTICNGVVRGCEGLSLKQTVPSTDVGASLAWSRRMLSPLLVSAGLDLHWIDGQSRDQVFDPDTAMLTDRIRSDGKQFFAGFFLQGIYTPTPQWEIALSGRTDLWENYDATVTDSTANSTTSYASRTRAAFNPRLSVLYRLTEWLHLRAAAYRAFRAPTLAELYRRSYVEGLEFLPNPNLSPERLNGAEAGVDLPVFDNVDLRATGFWAEIQDPMLDTNVAFDALGTPTARQRFNDGLARSFGAEVEALYEVIPGLTLSGSYLFNDATLVSSPHEPDIAGFQLAQIPPHSATVAVEYRNPKIITARLEGRFVDEQFEDQEHMDKQGSYFLLNASLARQLPIWNGEVFIAGENLTDREYTVDHGGGIRQIGSPLLVHGGVRFRL